METASFALVEQFLAKTNTKYAHMIRMLDTKEAGDDQVQFRVVFSKPTQTTPIPAIIVNTTFVVERKGNDFTLSFTGEWLSPPR